ncbi:hypothetical protein P4S72_03620 [Vibrio sp. PP-XX7]
MSHISDNPIYLVSVGAATATGESYSGYSGSGTGPDFPGNAEHPHLLDFRGERYFVAMAPYIVPECQGTSRFQCTAFNYALADCCEHLSLPASTPFILCLPEARPMFGAENKQQRSDSQLAEDCPGLRIPEQNVFMQGHAGAFPALTSVRHYLREHEFCLLAGVDSYIDSMTLNWLDSLSFVSHNQNAWGFTPGEAAACVLLCHEQVLEKYRLRSLGCLTAFSDALEPVHHTEGVCTGQGLSEALRQTLQHRPTEQKINRTICDLNGQTHRSDEYGFTLTRLSEHFEHPENFITPLTAGEMWGQLAAFCT